MAVCDWCKQEMRDSSVISCSGNEFVEFPDGTKMPSVKYEGRGFDLEQFADDKPKRDKLFSSFTPEYRELWRNFKTPQERMDHWISVIGNRCHDCNIDVGGYHHPGCDAERCPKCGGQLISCGCLDEPEKN